MNYEELKKLKDLAQNALHGHSRTEEDIENFRSAFKPAVVLALIEKLETAEQKIKNFSEYAEELECRDDEDCDHCVLMATIRGGE